MAAGLLTQRSLGLLQGHAKRAGMRTQGKYQRGTESQSEGQAFEGYIN
jgi:hypothetical protein